MIWLEAIVGLVVGAVAVALFSWHRRRRMRSELEADRLIIERANDPVLIADIVDGSISYANQAARRLLGYTLDEMRLLKLPELHPPELRSRSAEVIADVWEKGGLVYTELPFRSKLGERIAVEVSATIFRYLDRTAMLIFARDIRERQRLEAQLVQSEKMAALGQLVAGVAHEINTPVGAIHSNADLSGRAIEALHSFLEDERVACLLAENRKLKRTIGILDDICLTNREASRRIVDIVRALTNFARLDEADRKKVDLHEGIESTLTLLRHEIKKGIEVVRDYGAVPHVECYPNQLNQVFMNIVRNAIQAMDGAGEIVIKTRHEGDEVVVSISDTGSGIPSENLPRVFDPGFTTKGVGVGTGLGMSISYRIIEKHGGRIEVESEEGRGTTFIIRLPLTPAAPAEAEPAKAIAG